MSESTKQFMERMYGKAFHACAEAVKYSRFVTEFQVLKKKDFFGSWAATHSSGRVGGWAHVRKSHKYVGVLAIRYMSGILYYAESDHDPILAGSRVIQQAMCNFDGDKPDPIRKKLLRVLDKYVDDASKPRK